VDWWTRWRTDLGRPETPTGRHELVFLTASAALIITIAQISDPGSARDVIMLAPAFAAFVLRGLVPRMPAELFAALVLVPVTIVVGREGSLEISFFLGVMMTLYASWHLGSVTRAIIITAASAAMPLLVAEWLKPESGISWTPWASASVFTFSMGRLLGRQQALIHELERARKALAEQAVADERRRIARELHDLAGHTLAAMLLHVTGARHVLRRDIDETDRALSDAETIGRSSLDQIRATVAALRTDERGTDPPLAGSADVQQMIGEYRQAGLVIEARVADAASRLEGPTATALHRIAREALANVARHAPQNTVSVSLDIEQGLVHLVVADHGRPASSPQSDAGHFGLVGMRERARALGGRLDARPTSDGWIVEAHLPASAAHDPADDRCIAT
jgi:signal transduction histidine kinase